MKVLILFSTLTLLLPFSAEAAIYKCVNLDEEVYYNDKPCPILDIEKEFQAIKDPTGGYIPPEFTEKAQEVKSKGVVVGLSDRKAIKRKDSNISKNSEEIVNSFDDVDSSNSNKETELQLKLKAEENIKRAISNGSVSHPQKNIIPKEKDFKDL